MGLDLDVLRAANIARSPIDPSSFDMTSLLSDEQIEELANNMAITIIHLDRLACRCGVNLSQAILKEFNNLDSHIILSNGWYFDTKQTQNPQYVDSASGSQT